eukprot:TRINITY_DN4429_c0_g1_i3.p1 TRINITY_DN4429_c0_g1~~TRINITY_DN4429_c0_g1_i3.p1  ORF type:complete len:304 (+),score=36.29 TRINITY_DN4429_c0_g1_i3:80-991(+)
MANLYQALDEKAEQNGASSLKISAWKDRTKEWRQYASKYGRELVRMDRELWVMHRANNSPKTIFFLHGIGGRSEQFFDQIRFIADTRGDFNVVAFDLLGHGRSSKPEHEDSYTLNDMLDDVDAVVSQYGTSVNYVVGHGYGALLACMLAARPRSSSIHRLCFIGASAEPQSTNSSLFSCCPCFGSMNRPNLTKTSQLFHGMPDPFLRAEQNIIDQTPTHVLNACLNGLVWPQRDAFTSIPQETLIIHGNQDQIVPLSCAASLHALMSMSTFDVVDQAGHNVMQEEAELVSSKIYGFFCKNRLA